MLRWLTILFTLAWFHAPLGFAASAGEASPPRPNILLIVADDLGWSDVGWHGGFSKTPRMDQLVREGIELDQHYVQPVCTPTRAALLSGRYPGRFGPHALAPSNRRAMPLGTVTIASALQSLGYRTHLAGKWHLGARPEWIPNAYGFMSSYGTLTGAADPWTHKYRRGNPYEDTWHRDGKFFQEEGNATELIAAEALRRIEARQSPWFVYVPFHAVHTPVDAPEEFKRLYDGVSFHEDPVKHESRLRMAAMVSQLDAKIGSFVDALDRTGQRDNTLIIFTSDNGGIESLKNAYVGTVPDSPLNSENDPLRGQKGTLYEGGTRVCAFLNWPNRLAPRKDSTPMHAVDWFPTLATLVGYQPPREVDLKWDGVSHWARWSEATESNESGATEDTGGDTEDTGQAKKRKQGDPRNQGSQASDTSAGRSIYIAAQGGQSLRQGDWKIIRFNKGKVELYNLANDPFEKAELSHDEPQRVTKMLELLDAHKALDNPRIPEDLADLPH